MLRILVSPSKAVDDIGITLPPASVLISLVCSLVLVASQGFFTFLNKSELLSQFLCFARQLKTQTSPQITEKTVACASTEFFNQHTFLNW